MSSDKPLSLPMPNPTVNSNTSSPRSGGSSILNGPAGNSTAAAGTGPGAGGKVKTPTQTNTPTPSLQSNSHVLGHPTMPSPQTHTPGYASHAPGPAAQYGYGPESSPFMAHNGQPYVGVGIDFQNQHHLSQPQPNTPQTATSGNSLNHYPSHAGTMQPYSTGPHSSHPSYPQFHFPTTTGNGVSSPSQPGLSGQMGNALLPLPGSAGMTPAPSPHTTLPPTPSQTGQTSNNPVGAYGATHAFDTTGQLAPPGMKPRVTATLWEDEGSLCFQVEAKGVCVARREDNHMINGTKLLNVAGMTRGRRDGILKSEKVRHVVKIGPMHLKGVWIPFERALDFANKEKITELLYPLFVHNIGALLYHPTNTDRTSAVMAAVDRRRFEAANQQALVRRNPNESIPPSLHPPPMTPLHLNHTLGGHPQMRPDMAPRAMTFPTPPSSASSLIGPSENPYWSTPAMMTNSNSQQLAIDTVMNPTRSLPSTPATTPPAGNLNQLQQYPPQSFNDSRSSSLYSPQTSNISQQNMAQHGMTRFGPNQFMSQSRDNNMGPPSTARQSNSRPSSRQNTSDGQVKDENGVEVQSSLEESEQDVNQEEPENDPEQEVYHHDAHQYGNGTNRYFNNVEHTPHLSPDMTGSPNHQAPGTPNRSSFSNSSVGVSRSMENGSGSTSRTGTAPQQQQWVPNTGYSAPPVGASAASAVRHQASGRPYETTNGTTTNDSYSPHGIGVGSQSQFSNGINGTAKRFRDIDDQDDNGSRPSSRDQEDRGAEGDMTLKRRKTISQGPTQNGTTVNGSNMDRDAARVNRSRTTIMQNRRQR